MTTSSYGLKKTDHFIQRHIGPDNVEIKEMLSDINMSSIDNLIDKVVPKSIYTDADLPLDTALTETEALAKIRSYANKNIVNRSFIGMGYSDTILPPVIQRNVLENPGWYTAYTPYQPEISQGRLEALLNFQQMVVDLTAMDMANASMLDEATAAAEAMTLCQRVNKKNKSTAFLIANDLHPQTRAVLETRAKPLNIKLIEFTPEQGLPDTDAFGLILQYPNSYGHVQNIETLIEQAHGKNILTVIATDLLSLTLLKPPGEMGADVVIGSSQRFGVPMGYGGPHAAFFATKDAYKRSIPGRLVGVSVDKNGKSALRLALQTREQHIRREKATSNICTAQVLLANIAGLYAVYHGAEGLKNIASRIHAYTGILSAHLKEIGVAITSDTFFDTLNICTEQHTDILMKSAEDAGINLRKINDTYIGISLDEKTTAIEIDTLLAIFAKAYGQDITIDWENISDSITLSIPQNLIRKSDFLTHPVFNTHRSETEMMRYLKKLENKDIALNHSMIPLGSCTMKLNAVAEMMPITWSGFSDIHPFVPINQAQGYRAMIEELETMLSNITGFDAVSMQPNAGSQGEYSGLLIINAYHTSRGDTQRNICLIPASAHGTNPASAVLAGMKVVIVKCDENGNIDVSDLKEKAQEHAQDLAALMVTYPSTHGVFEPTIVEICQIIHDNGGQVYLDGANLNAMMGLAQPGKFGADVMHMNLHKTFCIPHGGGGPGVGPIGVGKHLAPFLPGSPVIKEAGGKYAISAISAAPWGSALILPISWMYIAMAGGHGIKKSSEIAILNANYLAQKLSKYYATLYTGENGFVAHECIIDTRHFKKDYGIGVEDIAKRLMDFGFHAPTVSFPVVNTLMIEPTESESKAEIDRFIDAMISIYHEIIDIKNGKFDKDDNPLCNAPHTLSDLSSDNWTHPYSRQQAVFPSPWVQENKYWPPINRIDQAAGDRNLVCTCPPLESYAQDEAA